MSIINPLKDVLHRVRIRLQRNNIRGHEETYVARVANEHVLSIEEVAAILIERAGSASHNRYLVFCNIQMPAFKFT